MGVHFAIHIPHIVGMFERHMAVGALLRLWRIVEGTRALARNAAGLPVVILVKPAEPAIAIHGYIEMHFVTGGAEFRSLLLHERLQEDPSMRLGVEFDHEIVEGAHHGILARRKYVQFR